jgi:transposase
LIEGLAAEHLLADRGYDSDAIVQEAQQASMQVVIPPRKNRNVQRVYDKHVYRQRHLIENAFLHLKRWRGIATRYAKNTASFLAAVQIRCLARWLSLNSSTLLSRRRSVSARMPLAAVTSSSIWRR